MFQLEEQWLITGNIVTIWHFLYRLSSPMIVWSAQSMSRFTHVGTSLHQICWENRQHCTWLIGHTFSMRKVQHQLLEENESYQSYCLNIFNGIHWGEPIIAAALSLMWNMPITIIMAMKYRVIKLFHWEQNFSYSTDSQWILWNIQ